MEKVFNIVVDTKNYNITEIRGLKQDDNENVLNIALTDNSVPYNFKDLKVRLNFLRPDRKVLMYMVDEKDIKDGEIRFKLSSEVVQKAGTIEADISIFTEDMRKVTSATFRLNVAKGVYSNDYFKSTNDYDMVQQVYMHEEQRVKNEKVRQSNEDNRVKNENERVTKENERLRNESEREKDEKVRISNENKRIEHEKTRMSNEESRIKNEENRTNTWNELKPEIEENIKLQNKKISEIEKINNEVKMHEEQRVKNETERISTEVERINNESMREKNEKTRIENEGQRVIKEDARISSEDERIKNEKNRVKNENQRIEDENIRITNEKERVEEWDKIKNNFKNNAPGDMKTIVYDKNGNGKVDVSEIAESVDWENVKNKPDIVNIGKVKSVNGMTGDVVLRYSDLAIDTNTVYVNEVTGTDNDNWLGSKEYPVRTLKRALEILNAPKKNLQESIILLASDITIFPYLLSNLTFKILGNNYSLSTSESEIIMYACNFKFLNVKFKRPLFTYNCTGSFQTCDFDTSNKDATFFSNSNILLKNCNINSSDRDALVCFEGSTVSCLDCTIEKCRTAMWVSSSMLSFNGNVKSCDQRKKTLKNGIIYDD